MTASAITVTTIATAALATGACVAIETAPGGVQSVRFDATPPSIVVGDSLRDSAGVVTTLRALAFDENDRVVATAPVRFAYVPIADSTGAVRGDSALVVDSLGAVRATRPLARPQGRVAARVGDRFQLIDTLEIVIAPDSLVPAADTTAVLRYDCTDTRTIVAAVPDTGSATFAFNTVTLPAITARGTDPTTGQRPGVRARLMRYEVDSGPFTPGAVPRAAVVPGGRDSVPAIAIVGAAVDRLRSLDTTAAATGASTVRLRIRPAALGREVVPARDFTVRVRVHGQPGPRPLANDPLYVRVRLSRNPTPLAGRPATCQ